MKPAARHLFHCDPATIVSWPSIATGQIKSPSLPTCTCPGSIAWSRTCPRMKSRAIHSWFRRLKLMVRSLFSFYPSSLSFRMNITQQEGEYANIALIRHGLLGTAPVHPAVAISLHMLELYHQLRRQQPCLSIQAMAQALCDLHKVCGDVCAHNSVRLIRFDQIHYHSTFCEQFSIAFNMYLDILCAVQKDIESVLTHDTPHWCIQNLCYC